MTPAQRRRQNRRDRIRQIERAIAAEFAKLTELETRATYTEVEYV